MRFSKAVSAQLMRHTIPTAAAYFNIKTSWTRLIATVPSNRVLGCLEATYGSELERSALSRHSDSESTEQQRFGHSEETDHNTDKGRNRQRHVKGCRHPATDGA
jgi:hypothetical protein